MENALSKFFVAVFAPALMASALCHATPEAIRNDKAYHDSLKMINELGKTGVIRAVVNMQNKQIREYGSSLDPYSDVLSVFGNDLGFHQTVQMKLNKMLTDVNKERVGAGKKPIRRDEMIGRIQKEKEFFGAQINMLCTNPATRAIIDNKISYTMKFYSDEMIFIGETTADNASCLKNDESHP